MSSRSEAMYVYKYSNIISSPLLLSNPGEKDCADSWSQSKISHYSVVTTQSRPDCMVTMSVIECEKRDNGISTVH